MSSIIRFFVLFSAVLLVACGSAPESKVDLQEEENKALVRLIFEEIGNKGNLDLIDKVYDANYVKCRNGEIVKESYEEQKQKSAIYRKAFPDGHQKIEDMVAEGDKVAFRWTFTGTHTGELMGIPPTGVQVKMTGITIYRITNGKVVEGWLNSDRLGVMQQLGVIPPIGQQGED